MAKSAIPERIEFAIELVDPKPGESVFEAGGGNGVAAALVCEVIAPDGSMTMIDRSALAVQRAVARNATALGSRLLSIEHGELAEFEGGPFDVYFSVDLNVFWTEWGTNEIAAVQRSLRPGGRAVVAYGIGPAGPHGDERLSQVGTNLEAAGFVEVAIIRDRRGTALTAIRK